MSKKELPAGILALVAAGKAQREAKKRGARKRKTNPFRETQARKNSSGGFDFVEVDTRLASPYWKICNRVLLVREVSCRCCGSIHSAPNETIMVRKEHPQHGVLEESISPHEATYDHLPILIEIHKGTTPFCQDCVQNAEVKICESPTDATPAEGDSPSDSPSTDMSESQSVPTVAAILSTSTGGSTATEEPERPAIATPSTSLTDPAALPSASNPPAFPLTRNGESDMDTLMEDDINPDDVFSDPANLQALEDF